MEREYEDNVRAALGSLFDIVGELAQAVANGDKPDREWLEVMHSTLDSHRKDFNFDTRG